MERELEEAAVSEAASAVVDASVGVAKPKRAVGITADNDFLDADWDADAKVSERLLLVLRRAIYSTGSLHHLFFFSSRCKMSFVALNPFKFV